MEEFNNEEFHVFFYSDVIEIIRPFIEKQLSIIPVDTYHNYYSFHQFLNKLIDPIILMNESFRITIEELQQDFIECVWHDVGTKPFEIVLSYIYHVKYQEQTPFHTLFKQLSKTYSISTITAARCVHDCIIHYIKDKYNYIVKK